MERLSTLIALFSCLAPLAAAAQEPDDPACTSVGREPARSEIIAYPTQKQALTFSHEANRYLDPVDGWEQRGNLFTSHFTMPFAWIDRQQFLHVEWASSAYEVTVNGTRAGYSQNGTAPADYDITSLAREGRNEVAVRVFDDSPALRLESRPEAAPAVGECYVTAQPRMRVRDIAIGSSIDNEQSGVLEIGVVMKTHSLNPNTTRVAYELIHADTLTVLEGYKDLTLDMRGEDTVRMMAVVPQSLKWSAETPTLYTLVVKTKREGRYNEYIPFRVGFRSVEYDREGIRVNGRPVALRIRDVASETAPSEVARLKAEGYNALRLQPGRLSRRLLNACDSVGMYVIAQIPLDTHASGTSREVGGNPSNDPAWRDAYIDRTRSYYEATKNHPSVIAYSLARRSANGINLYEAYLWLKRHEKHRPVLYPEADGEWNTDSVALP